jgi:hypothetical protein
VRLLLLVWAGEGLVPRTLLLVEGGQGDEQTQRQWDEWRAKHVDYEYIRYTHRHEAGTACLSRPFSIRSMKMKRQRGTTGRSRGLREEEAVWGC